MHKYLLKDWIFYIDKESDIYANYIVLKGRHISGDKAIWGRFNHADGWTLDYTFKLMGGIPKDEFYAPKKTNEELFAFFDKHNIKYEI